MYSKRIDFTWTNRLLEGLREHGVPISNSVNKSLLHAARDNFDYIEDTKSGTGSSHDTILMVFQNQKQKNDTVVLTPNKDDSENKQTICWYNPWISKEHSCKCSRAEIADHFAPGSDKVPENITQLWKEENNAGYQSPYRTNIRFQKK